MTYQASKGIFIPKGVDLINSNPHTLNKYEAKRRLEEYFPEYRITTQIAKKSVQIMDRNGISLKDAFNTFKEKVNKL